MYCDFLVVVPSFILGVVPVAAEDPGRSSAEAWLDDGSTEAASSSHGPR